MTPNFDPMLQAELPDYCDEIEDQSRAEARLYKDLS